MHITNQICFIPMVSWGSHSYLILITFLKWDPDVAQDAECFSRCFMILPTGKPRTALPYWGCCPLKHPSYICPSCTLYLLFPLKNSFSLDSRETRSLAPEKAVLMITTKELLATERFTPANGIFVFFCHCLQWRQKRWIEEKKMWLK